MGFRTVIAGCVAAMVAGTIAGPVLAADVALVISNAAYRHFETPGLGLGHAAQVDTLRSQGFEVIEGENVSRRDARELLRAFGARLEGADRAIVVYTGLAVLRRDARALIPVGNPLQNELSLAFDTIPMTAVTRLLATRPGRAAFFLGLPSEAPTRVAALSEGAPLRPLPPGVLSVAAPAEEMTAVLAAMLADPASVPATARVRGSVTPRQALARAGGPASDPVEEALWALARTTPTSELLETYLERYPNGRHVAEARRLLAALSPPEAAAEDALGLTRANRRDIQGQLRALGHRPGSLDGIFGPATRAAIARWQGATALPQTGYLTAAQVQLLASQGRAAAERAEAEARQAEEAFWRATGATGREAGLRDYLARYPNGRFAQEARGRLRQVDTDGRDGSGRTAEQQAWRAAREANTAASYSAYLAAHPNGARSEQARRRIQRLQAGAAAAAALAEQQRIEQTLNLTPPTRQMVEGRLASLNFAVGPVDGTFDASTRAALKAFQAAQGLEATGFVNPATLQRLILPR